MNQLTLFDSPPPIARRSDPQTSHDAAAEIEPAIGPMEAIVLRVIGRIPNAWTAKEIGTTCVQIDASHVMEDYRKRIYRLVKIGKVVKRDARRCRITGKQAETFWRDDR